MVAGVRSRWLTPIWRDYDVERDGQLAVVVAIIGWDVAPPSEPRMTASEYYREILCDSLLRGNAPAYDYQTGAYLGRCGANVDTRRNARHSASGGDTMRPGFGQQRQTTSNYRLDGTHRHELRMRLAHVYMEHADAPMISMSDRNLETLPQAVDEFGWDHVADVCEWTIRENVAGRIPAQLVSTMFRGDGFNARRNEYLQHKRVEQIREQERQEREQEQHAPRISADRMLEMLAQNPTFAAFAERMRGAPKTKAQPAPTKTPQGGAVQTLLAGVIQGSHP